MKLKLVTSVVLGLLMAGCNQSGEETNKADDNDKLKKVTSPAMSKIEPDTTADKPMSRFEIYKKGRYQGNTHKGGT